MYVHVLSSRSSGKAGREGTGAGEEIQRKEEKRPPGERWRATLKEAQRLCLSLSPRLLQSSGERHVGRQLRCRHERRRPSDGHDWRGRGTAAPELTGGTEEGEETQDKDAGTTGWPRKVPEEEGRWGKFYECCCVSRSHGRGSRSQQCCVCHSGLLPPLFLPLSLAQYPLSVGLPAQFQYPREQCAVVSPGQPKPRPFIGWGVAATDPSQFPSPCQQNTPESVQEQQLAAVCGCSIFSPFLSFSLQLCMLVQHL